MYYSVIYYFVHLLMVFHSCKSEITYLKIKEHQKQWFMLYERSGI